MTPTTNAGQDPAVAVLQMQQSTLDSSMRDLARTMSEGFASMNTKMDRLGDISLSLASMAARQEAHSDGLSRAFNELKSLREAMTKGIDDHAEYAEKQALIHSDIDKRMSTARGVALGLMFAWTSLIGLLTWAASTYIAETRENTSRIHQIQLENARIHGRTP